MTIDIKPVSGTVRIAGAFVILASAVTAVLAAMFASAPLRMNSVLALTMLAGALVSGIGSLGLIVATRNFLWAVALLPVVGIAVIWLLVAQMSQATFN